MTQWINFENSFNLITREVARVSLCYAAISYFGVTFSPVILRALNFNLFCLLIKHTICEPKIWYCRIAQCHSGILPGDLSEGIFKIDSLGHKRINKHFLKSSRRAYWTWSITIIMHFLDPFPILLPNVVFNQCWQQLCCLCNRQFQFQSGCARRLRLLLQSLVSGTYRILSFILIKMIKVRKFLDKCFHLFYSVSFIFVNQIL